MTNRKLALMWSLVALLCLPSNLANAQTDETPQQAADRINLATVTIVGGDIFSTSLELARDMGIVLNDGERLRVLPMIGLDDVQTVFDVLYLRGVDIGLVHEDSLNSIGVNDVIPDVRERLVHIARLSQDNIYVIASGDIADIGGLSGRVVNFGPGAPSDHTTPALLFSLLGIDVEPVNKDHAEAIEDIRNGDIAATVIVGGDPQDTAARLPSTDGLRLLSVPLPSGAEDYVPVTMADADFPSLIPAGTNVNTISVSLIMVAYDWPENHPRYEKNARFVEALFSRFEDFKKPLRHPKWSEVNLAAKVDNWTQFKPARQLIIRQQALQDEKIAKLENTFNRFIESREGNKELAPGERERMYQEFLSWPNNPFEAEVVIRRTTTDDIGEKLGTIVFRNIEISVSGRKEPALLIQPDLTGLQPGNYALRIHENPECGAGDDEGEAVPGFAAGNEIRLETTVSEYGLIAAGNIGDLPDMIADDNNTVTKDVVAIRHSLADVANRSVVLHANGEEASRLACGVVR